MGAAFVTGVVAAGPLTGVAAVLSERYVCGIREIHPNYIPFHFHYAVQNQAQRDRDEGHDGNGDEMLPRTMRNDHASANAYAPEPQHHSVAGHSYVGSNFVFYPQPRR